LVVQIDVKIQNTVTLGATVLNNNSASYASFAILINQAIGHQVIVILPQHSFLHDKVHCILTRQQHYGAILGRRMHPGAVLERLRCVWKAFMSRLALMCISSD